MVQRSANCPVTEGGCGAGQINKLLGHFQNQTGSSFTGGQDQFDQIAAMASKYTGFPVPASILRKLCAPCSMLQAVPCEDQACELLCCA